MSESSISTTGAVRAFLAKTMEDLKAGKIDANSAREITKAAGQIHKSMEAEVKVMKATLDSGNIPAKFGNLELGEKE